jgi:hypothetical protein
LRGVSQSPRIAIQKKTKNIKNIKTKTLFPAEVIEPSSFSKILEEQEQEHSFQAHGHYHNSSSCVPIVQTTQKFKTPPKFGRVLYFKKIQPTKKEIPPSWQTDVLSKLLLFCEVKYSVCIQMFQHAKDDNEEEEENDEDDGSFLLFLAFPFLLPSPSSAAAASFFSFALKCCQDLVSEQFLLCSFSSSLICMIKKLARVRNNGWMDGWMDVDG